MKPNRILYVLALLPMLGILISCTSPFRPLTKEDLQGNWYGLHFGSPFTLQMDDQLELFSEAFSSMNMACDYQVTEGDTARISVTQGATGMAGEGICALRDDTLEFLLIFGMPGQIPTPKTFSDGDGNPAALHCWLTRDSSIIEKATAKIEAPAEASLAFERNNRIGTGVNLNAVFDSETEVQPLDRKLIHAIAEKGFTSVRIPIRWAVHTSKEAPYTIDPQFFVRVDSVVDACLAEGLAVTLDNHYYPGISFGFGKMELSYEQNVERLHSIWQQLSVHYKGYSDETLFFELLNEPSLMLDPALWNEIIASTVEVIRKDNPGRTIIVSTPSLGQHWTIGLLKLPNDWNIIIDAHYYLPQTFTHQGLEYAMAGGLTDIPWNGTEADKAPLDIDYAFLSRWSERNGRPVNIGEYGCNSKADEASRARYLGYEQSLIRKYGFSSNLWAFHRDIFGIYDEANGRWNQSMLDAILK